MGRVHKNIPGANQVHLPKLPLEEKKAPRIKEHSNNPEGVFECKTLKCTGGGAGSPFVWEYTFFGGGRTE